MKIVLSVGGSLINPGKPDLAFMKRLSSLVAKLGKKHRFAILCGGGQPARDYANAVRGMNGGEFSADETAILLTRANASLLLSALGESAIQRVFTDFGEAGEAFASSGKIVVMGGTIPGITTDADSALLAEKIGAKRLVNISNVSAIYSADPKKDPSAKKLSVMRHSELMELANRSDLRKAGTNFVFDSLACKLIARSGIDTHFVGGKDLRQVEAAIGGARHGGTVVRN